MKQRIDIAYFEDSRIEDKAESLTALIVSTPGRTPFVIDMPSCFPDVMEENLAQLLRQLGHPFESIHTTSSDEDDGGGSTDQVVANGGLYPGLPRARLAFDEYWGDCEYCGSHVDTSLIFARQGAETPQAQFYRDGHLGGRPKYLREVMNELAAVFTDLGHDVVVTPGQQLSGRIDIAGHCGPLNDAGEARSLVNWLSQQASGVELDFSGVTVMSTEWLREFMEYNDVLTIGRPVAKATFSLRTNDLFDQRLGETKAEMPLPDWWGTVVINPEVPAHG